MKVIINAPYSKYHNKQGIAYLDESGEGYIVQFTDKNSNWYSKEEVIPVS